MNKQFGTLYLVATPIGNLTDLSPHALSVFTSVAAIYAEDTRVAKKLLTHFDIHKPVFSAYQQVETQVAPKIVARLQAGDDLALVSDAGMPVIADPGAAIVQTVLKAGIKVVPIAGPCALINALAGSGLKASEFHFAGFLPPKTTPKTKRLLAFINCNFPVVFYEAPHRIIDTLNLIAKLIPARQLIIARELTKKYEQFYYGQATDLLEVADQLTRGELVLIISPASVSTPTVDWDQIKTELLWMTKTLKLPLQPVIKIMIKYYPVSKNELYDYYLAITKGAPSANESKS